MSPTAEKPLSGLLQSETEWDARNRALADSLISLIDKYAPKGAQQGLDIGCQHGDLTDEWNRRTELEWTGIDPGIDRPKASAHETPLLPGSASSIPFPDAEFDCVVLANVYEHIAPAERVASMAEMNRVLRPGGVIVGQLPNPYFPIESHSRLPFMGWLPVRAQNAYWRLAPVDWEHDFYVVGISHVKRTSREVGLEIVLTQNFSYPPEVIPQRVRWAAKLLAGPMRVFPWAWQFVLRKP